MNKFIPIIPLLVPSVSLAATEKLISVDGSCTRQVVSDRGAITVTADHLDRDLKTAVSKSTQAYERVKEAVKKLGLESLELETAEYSVQEAREWEKDRSVSKGFRARMGLKIATSSISKLGEVIAIAGREGIRDVGALSTYLSREKLKEEKMACLQEAAIHARAKADKLASSLSARAGSVVSITEGVPASPSPVFESRAMPQMAMADSKMGAPSVETSRQEVSVTIQASFELK